MMIPQPLQPVNWLRQAVGAARQVIAQPPSVPIEPASPSLVSLVRPNLAQLAQPGTDLPRFVADCAVARKYLELLGPLDWANFPERDPHRAWPGPTPAPRAPFVASYLVKLHEGKVYMSDLRDYLVEHPALVDHERGRYACPLLFPVAIGQVCPLNHKNWPHGGCLTTMATSIGARLRYQLDRDSDAFNTIYKQRTATELGIERPKLRNRRAITNQDTLIYVLINLRGLQRVRSKKAELTAQPVLSSVEGETTLNRN